MGFMPQVRESCLVLALIIYGYLYMEVVCVRSFFLCLLVLLWFVPGFAFRVFFNYAIMRFGLTKIGPSYGIVNIFPRLLEGKSI